MSVATNRLRHIVQRISNGHDSIDRLRGFEGEAARLYFSVFGHMIRVPEPEMAFAGRNRRPPRDPVNALLSFLYTLLVHDCNSAAESVGLDPAVGFFHRDRPGRPSLALDLMEELRPVLADRLALSLGSNRRQIVSRAKGLPNPRRRQRLNERCRTQNSSQCLAGAKACRAPSSFSGGASTARLSSIPPSAVTGPAS